MRAKKILETCLYVEDLDAAEAFYVDIMGLEKFAAVQGRHCFFRVQDGVFLLFNPKATQDETIEGIGAHGAFGEGHAAFEMDDSEIEAWRTHLEEHGVKIESDFTWPSGGRSLYFRDPSGNSLELVTRKTWGL